jgi:hypothetical protein
MNIATGEKLKRTQDLIWFSNVPTSTGVRSFYFSLYQNRVT